MESAIWTAPIIILGWSVVILIINTIVLVVTKEPGQDANGQVRRTKSIFASKKIIGYTAAFLLPINFALTFLIYTSYGNLVPGADVTDNYFLLSETVLMSIFVFIGLYLLGLILGVLGVAIIFFEEKDRRYTMIAWVGLLSHVLSLVILPIAFVVSVKMIVQEIEYELNPAKIIERAVGKKKVDLSGKSLTSVKELENLTQLEELDLSSNKLTSVKELENLTQLKTLVLSYNQLTSVKELENLTQLEELNLAYNQLTPLKELEKLTQLTTLDLQGNRLTSVKELENLIQLKNLYLSYNQLTSVKELEKLTQVKTLNLRYNQLTDVKGLEKLTQLTSLNLSVNKLTDVKGLENLKQLKKLDLDDNPDLTKAQIDQLKKALPKCKIDSNPTK